MNTPAETLTKEEQQELASCERIISGGLRTFRDVGEAIIIIRDKRLWRHCNKSFEGYFREKFGIGKSRVYQLCEAAETVREISTIVDFEPVNEAQVRPLNQLDSPQEKAAAITEARAVAASQDREMTAHDVEEAVAERKRKANDAQLLEALGNPTVAQINSLISEPQPKRMSAEVLLSEFEAFLRLIDNQNYPEPDKERIFNKMECKLRHHRKSQTPAAA